MNNYYLVQFEKSMQVTEDSWRITRPSIRVHFTTDLQQILKWAIENNGNRLPEKLEIREITELSGL